MQLGHVLQTVHHTMKVNRHDELRLTPMRQPMTEYLSDVSYVHLISTKREERNDIGLGWQDSVIQAQWFAQATNLPCRVISSHRGKSAHHRFR